MTDEEMDREAEVVCSFSKVSISHLVLLRRLTWTGLKRIVLLELRIRWGKH